MIAYRVREPAMEIVPASVRREWMDATPSGFARRCLPLNFANSWGWHLLSPVACTASWNGGTAPDAVQVEAEQPSGLAPTGHFGSGVLTFHTGWLFRTQAPLALWMGGPLNALKDGIQPLAGIVESDWLPFPATMNWRFTRPSSVRFEQGEPIAQIAIVRLADVEIQPEQRPISDVPALERRYREYAASRVKFNASARSPADWQGFAVRGTDASGERSAGSDHRTRLRVCPFTERLDQ